MTPGIPSRRTSPCRAQEPARLGPVPAVGEICGPRIPICTTGSGRPRRTRRRGASAHRGGRARPTVRTTCRSARRRGWGRAARRAPRRRAQRQRDRVVSTDRGGVTPAASAPRTPRSLVRARPSTRARRHVAEVGDRARLERLRAVARAVHGAHHRRGVAHLARPEARARTVRHAAVERHAEEAHVDRRQRLARHERGAHERRHAGVPRSQHLAAHAKVVASRHGSREWAAPCRTRRAPRSGRRSRGPSTQGSQHATAVHHCSKARGPA